MTAITIPAREVGRSAAARVAAAELLVAHLVSRPVSPGSGRGRLGVPREIELGRITGGRI